MSIRISEDNRFLIWKIGEEENQFEIKEDDNGRYIEKESLSKIVRYDLIESKEQIEERAKTGNFNCSVFLIEANFRSATFENEANFSRAIFTKNANFRSTTFEQEANFKGAIFGKDVYFNKAVFDKRAHFRSATFEGDAYFRNAKFAQETIFRNVKFEKEAYFRKVVFKEKANFFKAIFHQEVKFFGVSFHRDAYFYGSAFYEKVGFQGAKFEKEANFREAIFAQKADFEKMVVKGQFIFTGVNKAKEQEHFTLDLKLAQIEGMSYADTNINRADNRETFLILKSLALKNSDQVKALEFHTKEMEQYKNELKKDAKVKWSDSLILWFEETTSYFGTNPLRAISYLVGLNLVWILFFIITLWGWYDITYIDGMSLMDYHINPLHLFSNVSDEVLKHHGTLTILEVVGLLLLSLLNFIKNILTAILIYEVIKSFRKYSRKL